MQPNCSVQLPFYFFPVKFLAWLMEAGEEMHPSKTASLGFARALFQSACWPWADYELWLFYFFKAFSTLKFTNPMPDYFLSLTVLQNWNHSAAILGSARHGQRCHQQLLDRRKLRLKSRVYFLPYIVLEDYFWHTGKSHKITIKLSLANSICDLKYSRGVCQDSENWWQVSLPG